VTDLGRAVAAGLLAAVVLGGCGIPGAERPLETVPAVPTLSTGEPGQTFEALPPPPPVSWDGAGLLAVVTYGSSSCPTAPTDITVAGDQELVLDIASLHPDRDPCTADVAPRTTRLELPDGVSAEEELTVRLRYRPGEEDTVVLPPAGR
jgi:hypothetical protein